VGPFPAGGKAEKTVVRHLRGASLIASREPASTAYLQHHGIVDNVVSCADPAYILASSTAVDGGTRQHRIGVNLSPLSVRYSETPLDLAAIVAEQARTLSTIANELGVEIVLIPHVVSDAVQRDDDLGYLRRVLDAIPAESRRRVTLDAECRGYMGVKKVLRQCDLVIASRMHCAINAISELVPTILLAYSKKAVGMAEYVYGDQRWVVPIGEFASQAMVDKAHAMLNSREALIVSLSRRLPMILADARAAVTALHSLVHPCMAVCA
jgi:polysaccharide pyruvyl transferase WcaK-like protein